VYKYSIRIIWDAQKQKNERDGAGNAEEPEYGPIDFEREPSAYGMIILTSSPVTPQALEIRYKNMLDINYF
jgi:hypothetical protein